MERYERELAGHSQVTLIRRSGVSAHHLFTVQVPAEIRDQVLAGLLMWVGMMPILMLRLALAFFAWSQTEAKRAGQI